MSEKNKQKIALITGVTGQDGSYLAEFLLEKGYQVIGLKRRTSTINTTRIDHLYNNKNFVLRYFDLSDVGNMYSLLTEYCPDEIYHLACQSHVRVSFELSEFTVDTITMGTLRLLNAVKQVIPSARFYQGSSSEMFGDNPKLPLNEKSKLQPCSPYACGKVFAHHLIHNYRKSYNMFAVSGILMNHSSPRRGETFITKKIVNGACKIKLGLMDKLFLGNLEAKRDIGYAKEYVECMYLMLQQSEPKDFVISTGKSYSVKEMCEIVFEKVGLGNYEKYIEIDPRLFRPHEVPHLLGDSNLAKKELKWQPKTTFEQLMDIMIESEMKQFKINKGE